MDEAKNILFYDGHCGLCHRWVKFTLARDSEEKFLFAPLQGSTFASKLSSQEIDLEQKKLPDSVVVYSRDGKVLTRSRAIFFLLKELGGNSAILGKIGELLPVALSDLGYNFIASIRYRLFARPKDLCPLVPSELAKRFLT